MIDACAKALQNQDSLDKAILKVIVSYNRFNQELVKSSATTPFF